MVEEVLETVWTAVEEEERILCPRGGWNARRTTPSLRKWLPRDFFGMNICTSYRGRMPGGESGSAEAAAGGEACQRHAEYRRESRVTGCEHVRL